jgi:SagB-type dehydrogenase family enzyme
MRLKRKKPVHREGPLEKQGGFNPWLLLHHSIRYANPQATGQVGFVTNQHTHANRVFDPRDALGDLFLENTKYNSQCAEWAASVQEYFSSYLAPVLALSGSESMDSSASLPLPEPTPLDMSLGEVLRHRHSVRRFSGDSLHLEDLAAILHAGSGITHKVEGRAIDGGSPYTLLLRSVPSAGGLYPVDCYCLALRVRSLPTSAYKYQPHYHSLGQVHPEPTLASLLSGLAGADRLGIDIRKVAAILAFVGHPQKVVRKYGARGVRYLLIEAGMMAMAANLAAVALGYGTLDYQSFFDDRLHEALSIAGRPQQVLHLLFLGWPAEAGMEAVHA